MTLLHDELLRSEVDSRLEEARAARFKHSLDTRRRSVQRAERAWAELEQALAYEGDDVAAAPVSRPAVPSFARSRDGVPGWAA